MLSNKFGNIGVYIKSDTGKYIISILLGLGVASLFRKICTDDSNCLVYRGSPAEEVEGKSFPFNDKCYTYSIHPVTCDEKKRIVRFEENA